MSYFCSVLLARGRRPLYVVDLRIRRLWPGVLAQLETRTMTLDEAAAELGCDERTIRRWRDRVERIRRAQAVVDRMASLPCD